MATGRLAYLDNLRVALTVLVVYHHTAITYGASGNWYYVEPTDPGLVGVVLTLFVTFNQSFFLGAFFLLSGLFAPASYDRTGPWRFLADRVTRLGVPLALYGLVVGPTVVYYLDVAPRTTLRRYLVTEVATLRAVELGPLWFVELLLLFTLGYAAWRAVRGPGRARALPTPLPAPSDRVVAAAALAVGLCAFLVRLVFPVGVGVLGGIQPAYLVSYVVLFVVGLAAARRGWLDAVDARTARRWLPPVVALVAAMPALFVLGGALSGDVGAFLGGPTLQSLAYAVWEPLVGFGTILVLLGWFRARLDADGPAAAWLADTAYAVYVFHAPVLVATSYAVRDAALSLPAKFLLVGSVATAATFLLAGAVTRLPLADRVF
jgi:peptidoglycan/LPS O-acetylase OafA/YrhL